MNGQTGHPTAVTLGTVTGGIATGTIGPSRCTLAQALGAKDTTTVGRARPLGAKGAVVQHNLHHSNSHLDAPTTDDHRTLRVEIFGDLRSMLLDRKSAGFQRRWSGDVFRRFLHARDSIRCC